MDLIDRKAVLEALDELDSHQTMSRYLYRKDLANVRLGISMAVDEVMSQPTVIVYCKDCYHFDAYDCPDGYGICRLHDDSEWYGYAHCSYGCE